jgi:hypothetical protein
MRILVKIIESFCADYDITINAKKTKIMRLTPNYSIEEGVILMGGQVIGWVGNFKFLGVIISGTYDEHYKNRKKLFFSGLAEVNKLGFSKPELSTKIKALLYTALVRSKLVYGFETINMGKKNILGNLESNLIKNSYQLSKHSKTKILMYAMHISPMETYLLKRKINFLRQLANNESQLTSYLIGAIIRSKT